MSADDVREPTLLLSALAPGPKYGYALMEAVADLSGGRVRLKPGSLYATLDRLEREGLVSESGTEVVAGRRRLYYELTDAGSEALSNQAARLERLAETASEAVRRRRETIGLYLAFMTSALLVVWSRPGLARVLLLTAAAYATWMLATAGGAYPVPRAAFLITLVGLGLLASLAMLELGRSARRRMVSTGAAFVILVVASLLLTKPLLGWSVGTMTTSGNVAAAALAVVLSVLSGAAILLAASLGARWPGWAAALAVTAVPLVLYCTAISVLVNHVHTASRSLIPLAYLSVLGFVAIATHRRFGHHRRRHANRLSWGSASRQTSSRTVTADAP